VDVLPVRRYSRAFVIGDADGHEQHGDRDQQKSQGEQPGTWNAAAIAAVITTATASAIERWVIEWASAAGSAELYFGDFDSQRHTFTITPSVI
jgi:hypothetical protein